MSIDEQDTTGQTPNYARKRFAPCPCDSARGRNCSTCRCDDGTVSHGGVEYERLEHEADGFPRRVWMFGALRRLIAMALPPRADTTPEVLAVEAEIDELPESVRRARSMVGKGRYKLGAGGKRPEAETPFDADGGADCSGFVCWAHGRPRQDPKTKRWLNTDEMQRLGEAQGIPWEQAEPGDVVAYGAGAKIGHCGIVSEVDAKGPSRVIHCQARGRVAVVETSADLFQRHGAVILRLR